jgi:predicted Rossmann fold nucleotide-binding protein DprA/Smf involved in DNA uptake
VRVIIAGSRTITSYMEVEAAYKFSPFSKEEDITIISGNAPGVDRLGEQVAREWALDRVIFPANWARHKQAAGAIRNTEMAAYADALVAVWDGESKGTAHMIKTMEALGKPVFVYNTAISKI